MLSRFIEVAPLSSFLASNADFETLAWRSSNIADTPMLALAVSIRKKILRQLGDPLAQQFLDSSRIDHCMAPD